MTNNAKDIDQSEVQWRGCRGERVSYDELDQFLGDAFLLDDVNEKTGGERFGTCIWGHTGIGKCVSGETMVVSDAGIHDVACLFDGPDEDSEHDACGMTVHSPSLNHPMKKVGFLYYSGVKPSIGFRTSYGRELVSSVIHPVKVLSHDGYRFVQMWAIKTGDMVVVDWIRCDRSDAALPSLRLPHLNMKIDFSVPERMSPDLAFVLGALVGEGDKMNRHSVSLCQSRGKLSAVEYCEKMRGLFGLDCSEVQNKRTSDTYTYFIHRTALRTWLADIGLYYANSKTTEVPVSVLQSSRESQKSFIVALYECEGDCAESGIYLSSNSKKLLSQVQLILMQFRVVASLVPKKKAWRLASEIPFNRLRNDVSWIRCDFPDKSNKDGVPASWAFTFLRSMKDSHLANGGLLTKKQVHSYPLNNIYGDSWKSRKMWTCDEVKKISDMLSCADESFRMCPLTIFCGIAVGLGDGITGALPHKR